MGRQVAVIGGSGVAQDSDGALAAEEVGRLIAERGATLRDAAVAVGTSPPTVSG